MAGYRYRSYRRGGGYRHRTRYRYYHYPTGLLPGAEHQIQIPVPIQIQTHTGQIPITTEMGAATKIETGRQSAHTHSNCVNFIPPDRCALKDIVVNPAGMACRDFQPRASPAVRYHSEVMNEEDKG